MFRKGYALREEQAGARDLRGSLHRYPLEAPEGRSAQLGVGQVANGSGGEALEGHHVVLEVYRRDGRFEEIAPSPVREAVAVPTGKLIITELFESRICFTLGPRCGRTR